MWQALQRVAPHVPYVTILTDLADLPPHFWIEPREQRQYFICGTSRAVCQARHLGHQAGRVIRTSGMILHPKYYGLGPAMRDDGLRLLGLRPGLPTGLVLFGGHGSNAMEMILDRLEASAHDLQLIFICGRNERLADRLRARRRRLPTWVEGFTTELPSYMRLADFFVGKPGPGCISEALAMGLPLILERNAWTLVQERYNTDWVRDEGVGVVVRDFNEIADAVAEVLDPRRYAAMQQRIASLRNAAVFEVADHLDRILLEGVPA
jgi:1,2-diacylglycerol 3-beta-galactosyltransferase